MFRIGVANITYLGIMTGLMAESAGSEDARWQPISLGLSLDADSQPVFDDLTQLLVQICDTPIALIVLCDRNQQWVLSQIGLSMAQCLNPGKLIPPNLHKLVVIPDALIDPQFCNYPLVTHAPGIRCWAGVPLVSSTGSMQPSGLVSVMDMHPRQLNNAQQTGLQTIANQVLLRLQLRQEVARRRQLEHGLWQSEEYNRLMIEGMRDYTICLLDATGCIVNWQTQTKHPREYTAAEIIGRHFSCLYSSEAVRHGKPQQDLKQAIAKGYFAEEGWRQGQDGSQFWANVSITPLRDESGRLHGFLQLQRDISDRKRAASLLVGQNRVLEMLATGATLKAILTALAETVETQSSNLRCAILLLDTLQLSLRYIAAPNLPKAYREATDNQSIGPQSGPYGTAAFLAKPIFTTEIATDPLWEQERDLALAHGLHACAAMPLLSNKKQILGVLTIYFTQAGSPTLQDLQLIQIATHMAGITLEHKRNHDELEQQVVARTLELARANQELQVEISERKRAEDEVRRALKKEQELSELKSSFITIASHEFRTPLSTILFSAGLLEKYGHKWSEERKLEHLQRIQVAVTNMTQMLEEVLLIGKAEAAKLELTPSRLNLEQFCRLLVEDIQLSTNNTHQIQFYCPSPLATEVWLDEKLLQHIFRNLLGNAVKYSPEGGTITFELTYTDRTIIFQVKDQGIGIPSVDQAHLFEPFHRGTNVGDIMGTGLGLSIVKSCVDVHQGDINVVSESGAGTTFTVHLPLVQ